MLQYSQNSSCFLPIFATLNIVLLLYKWKIWSCSARNKMLWALYIGTFHPVNSTMFDQVLPDLWLLLSQATSLAAALRFRLVNIFKFSKPITHMQFLCLQFFSLPLSLTNSYSFVRFQLTCNIFQQAFPNS